MDPTNSLTRFIDNIKDDYLKTAFTNIDIDSLKPEEVAEMLSDDTRLIEPFLEAIQKDPTCDFHWLFEQRQFLSELSKGLANRIKLKQSAAKTAKLKRIQESVNRILPPTIWPSDDLMPVRYWLAAKHSEEFEKRWPDVRLLELKEARDAYATFMHTKQLPPCNEKMLFMLLETAIQYLDEASPEDRPEIFREVHRALLSACIKRLDPKQALKTILLFSERDIHLYHVVTRTLLEKKEVWREVETLKKEQLKPVLDTFLRHLKRSKHLERSQHLVVEDLPQRLVAKLVTLKRKIWKNKDLSELAEADFSKQWLIPTRDGKFIETVDKSDLMTRAWSKERMAPKLKEAVDILSTFVENNDLQIQDIESVLQLISKLHTVARKLPGEEGAPLRETLDKIEGVAQQKFVAIAQEPYSISEAVNQLAKAKVEELNTTFTLLDSCSFYSGSEHQLRFIHYLFDSSKPQEVLPIIKHLEMIANSDIKYNSLAVFLETNKHKFEASMRAMDYLPADHVDDFIAWIKEGNLSRAMWLKGFVIDRANRMRMVQGKLFVIDRVNRLRMDQGKLLELLSRLPDNVIEKALAIRNPSISQYAPDFSDTLTLFQVHNAFDKAYPGRLKADYPRHLIW